MAAPPVGKSPQATEPRAPKPPAPPTPRKPDVQNTPPPAPKPLPDNLFTGGPFHPASPIDKAIARSNDPNYLSKQQRRTKVILRRQGILRGLGLYTGAIDGVWGPKSQRAWSVYVYRRRNGSDLNAPFITPEQLVSQEKAAAKTGHLEDVRRNAAIARAGTTNAVAVARQLAAPGALTQDNVGREKFDAQRAAADVKATLARETRTNVALMHKLKADPAAVAKVNLHQLTAAVTDHANHWSPLRRDDVLVVQRWLNTHGHAVALTGQFDRDTNDALARASRQADIAQRNHEISLVVQRFYGGTEGVTPEWWTAPGPVPQPAQLLATLQKGGPASAKLLKQIIAHMNEPQYVYAQWRDQQLAAMLKKYGRPGDTAFNSHDALAADVAEVLRRSGRVLSPQSQQMLATQVSFLVNSRTGDEFARRIAGSIAFTDQQYKREQAARAVKHTTWWGSAAHYAMVPLNEAEKGVTFLKTSFITDFYMGADLLTTGHLVHPLADYWEGGVQAQQNAPTILRLANAWIADPLLYLRPLRAGSTLIRYGARLPIVERDVFGGYKLAAETGRFGALSRRVVYDGATWHLPIKTAIGTQFRRLPGVGKALSLKSDLIDQSQQKLIVASRHGFKNPRKAFAALGAHTSYENRITGKARAMIDQAARDISTGANYAHAALVDALAEGGHSLYADAYRRNLSMDGNRIVGRWAEEIRVQEVHRLANRYSQDAYDIARSGGITSRDYTDLMTKHGVETDASGEVIRAVGAKNTAVADFKAAIEKIQAAHGEPPLAHDAAVRRAFDAYKDVKQRVGLFFAGSGDPELTAVVDKRTASLLEQFKEITLPAIQNLLEDRYDSIGHVIWGEDGSFIGETSAAMSEAAGAAFQRQNLVELKNPLYGQELTLEQAIPVIQSEVRRKQARLLNWADTQKAHGNPIPDNAIAKLLARVDRDVRSSFVEGDSEYHVTINRDAVDALLESQGLPAHIPVEVDWRPGSKLWGEYNGGRVRIHADPEQLSKIDVLGDPAHRFLQAQYHATVAHEIRHAFQDVNWPQDVFRDTSKHYADRPIEVDARNFEASHFVVNFDDLVTISRPRAGVIVDTRKTLLVPDIYARDHIKTFSYMTPRWAENDAAANRLLYNEPLHAIAAAPRDADLSPIDAEIGKAVWTLGSLHTDSLNNLAHSAGYEGADGTARRFHAPKGTPFEQWGRDAYRMNDYRQATQMMHIALGQATDQALPFALLENHLAMVALANAQSAPFQALYTALNGAMNSWVFFTLPMRTGWMVRNVADNAIKSFIAGARDPRDYFRVYQGGRISSAIGDTAARVVSIFDAGMGPLLETIRFFDSIFGTDAAGHFATVLDTFWTHQLDVIDRVFKTQGWNVPPEVLDGARLNPFQRRPGPARLTKTGLFDPEEVDQLPADFKDAYAKHFDPISETAGRYERFRDGMWHLFANTPENYYKKVIYNTTMRDLRAQGMSAVDAHEHAWAKVEATLFDYSKITGIEDNMRIFFPFIQFWRKNTGLWARNFAQNPWLTVEMNNYLRERDQLHEDEPGWMRRYFSTKEITDVTASVPGLGWLANQTLPKDGQFDPLSFASFSPYYRAFKADNPTLPADQQGMAFIGPMLDAMNDWGLGMSPFVRKPLESAHIASQRAWQTVFPETSLASAFTRKFFGDAAGGYVLDWERIFTLMQGKAPSDQLAQSFEQYVRREEENQIADGQPANRAKAEATIRSWFLAQNVWGFFGGIYFRRNTPEDFYAVQLQNDVMTGGKQYADLSQRDKTLLTLWGKTGIDKTTGRFRIDRHTWDEYVTNLPMIEAFFKQPDYKAGQVFLHDHPEIIHYVDPSFTKGRYFGENYVKSAAMYLHGAQFFDVNTLLSELKLPYAMRKAATANLVTPDLQAFWAKNDTPADIRHKMMSAELHNYIARQNDGYWAIPATDPAARSEYLRDHPDLARSWQHNNTLADDYHALANTAKSDLREVYFATVREHGWNAAVGILREYPFMFEGTKSANRFDEKTLTWAPKNMGPEQSAAFQAARPAIAHYFQLRDNGNKAAANAWLDSDAPEAKLARDYFRKWGKHRALAAAYLRAKPWLTRFFNMPHADREAWLRGNTPGARIVRDYFAKYGHKGGLTAHARAYLTAKSAIDHYFSLDKSARAGWLKTGGHDAALVLDYFKRFGSTAKLERAFRAARPGLITTDPELRKRLDFWTNYFALTPDQRPAYILSDAENHGVFIFGALGDGDIHAREQKFIREAMAATLTVNGKKQHLSRRTATWLYVKPLLNQLYTVPSKDRQLFIDANPELKEYLATYSHQSFTGHKGLDAKIGHYFSLAQGSAERAAYLAANDDVKAYFVKNSTPEQRAMFALLDVFFALPRRDMAGFKLEHPEIQAYFDQLRLEQAQNNAIAEAFDSTDPRLHPYWTGQHSDFSAGGARMLDLLREAHIRQYQPKTIATRRDRAPAADAGLGGKKVHKTV